MIQFGPYLALLFTGLCVGYLAGWIAGRISRDPRCACGRRAPYSRRGKAMCRICFQIADLEEGDR